MIRYFMEALYLFSHLEHLLPSRVRGLVYFQRLSYFSPFSANTLAIVKIKIQIAKLSNQNQELLVIVNETPLFTVKFIFIPKISSIVCNRTCVHNEKTKYSIMQMHQIPTILKIFFTIIFILIIPTPLCPQKRQLEIHQTIFQSLFRLP